MGHEYEKQKQIIGTPNCAFCSAAVCKTHAPTVSHRGKSCFPPWEIIHARFHVDSARIPNVPKTISQDSIDTCINLILVKLVMREHFLVLNHWPSMVSEASMTIPHSSKIVKHCERLHEHVLASAQVQDQIVPRLLVEILSSH